MAEILWPAMLPLLDGNADLINNGYLYFFEEDGVTPKNTFSDSALTVANPHPIRTNAAGRPYDGNSAEIAIWGSGLYKLVVHDAADALIIGRNPYIGFGSFLQSLTGAVARTTDEKFSDLLNAADFGAVDDNSTDNTSKVQAALDAALGRMVFINDNTLFSLAGLTFPDSNFATNKGRYALTYRADDDTSDPAHPSAFATGERRVFLQNNNPSGYTNSVNFNSGYSTAITLDVRRDVNAPNIGAGQDIEFGRTSVEWLQDGLNRVQFKYTDTAGDTSVPGLDDGWTCQFWEPRVTITGIKQSSFSATLVVNDMVKGTTSGARGWVKVINAGDIIVTLLSGNTSTNPSGFQTGETIILEPAQETTTDTPTAVDAVAYTSRSNRLGFSSKQIGNMFSNIQGDDAVFPFVVGGIVGIQQANTTNGSFTNAAIVLADDFGNVTEQVTLLMEAATGDWVFQNGTTNLVTLRGEDSSGTAIVTTQIFRASQELQATSATGLIRLGTAGSDPKIIKGTGSPEGADTADIGSLFVQTDGGAGTTLWVKESGSGNTGWAAV